MKWRPVIRGIAALVAITGAYLSTREPGVSAAERRRLAARFHLTRLALPSLDDKPLRSEREVNPSVRHLAAWISSVGAGAALADLDGDGLANEVCYVDPRFDAVVVTSAPRLSFSSGFQMFRLQPRAVPEDATVAPMGCLPGDVNEDGLIDLLVYYWGRPPMAYLRRSLTTLSAAAFTPQPLVDGAEQWYTNAMTRADVDGDGHPDLVVGNYFPDAADVLNPRSTRITPMQHSMSRALNGGRNRLLLWRSASPGPMPSVRYLDASAALPEDAQRGWTLAIAAADLDGDLLPELYFANDFGPDRLLANRSSPGSPRFAQLEGRRGPRMPASKVLGHDSFKGMGVDIGDLNGDGTADIAVSNITEPYALEESNLLFLGTGRTAGMRDGAAPFVERSESLGVARSGWAWDIKFADLDNAGTPEILQAVGFVRGRVNRWPELQELASGNDQLLSHAAAWPNFGPGTDISGRSHNRLFARASNGRYVDIAGEVGFEEAAPSRGIALSDYDGDGDLDLVVANQWAPASFYRNDCTECGRFVGLQLLIPVSPEHASATVALEGAVAPQAPSRSAIGATATVLLDDGGRPSLQVDGGNGHSGKRSAQLLFGLGHTAPGPVRVEIHWRDRAGIALRDTLRLAATGWYTVVLRDAPREAR